MSHAQKLLVPLHRPKYLQESVINFDYMHVKLVLKFYQPLNLYLFLFNTAKNKTQECQLHRKNVIMEGLINEF